MRLTAKSAKPVEPRTTTAFGMSLEAYIAALRGWLETINDKLGMPESDCEPWERPSSMH